MPFWVSLLRRRATNLSVWGSYRYRWVEESFTPQDRTGNVSAIPESREFVGQSTLPVRLMRGILLVLLCVFTAKIFYLQIYRGENFFLLAEENRVRLQSIPAARGIIYDKNKTPLVHNRNSYAIAVSPHDLPISPDERRAILERVALILAMPVADIEQTIAAYERYAFESITLTEGIEYETALKITVGAAGLPGIRVENRATRSYDAMRSGSYGAATSSLAHLLGYVGKLSPEELERRFREGYLPTDRIGKTGLELQYEDFLRGTYGRRKVEIDARGAAGLVLAEEAPIPGKHLVLTIDARLQEALDSALEQAIKTSGAKSGAAVALDPRNGSVQALASYPSYDNNLFAQRISADDFQTLITDPARPLFNRAISGTYPSGSTIKPLIASAGLQEKLIAPWTTVLSNGGIGVGQWFFPDWKAGGHGATNVLRAIAESVNTFFYVLGGGHGEVEGLGVERMTNYLKKFGLGRQLGIDLPGEAAGLLPSPAWKQETKNERWYIGDTYNLSIGQGDVLVTPLQIAAATAAVANGGTVYRPRLVDRVIDAAIAEVQPIEPQVISSSFVDREHLAVVAAGMRQCVTQGSCVRLSTLPFTTAGKTGTAQWSSVRPNHAWFTGFAPFDNPKTVITVIIEEGEEGSKSALPAAMDFLIDWSKLEAL